jgi:ankyrin repeat protein
MTKATLAIVCLLSSQVFHAQSEQTLRERVEAARNWARQHDWYRVFNQLADQDQAKGTWRITLAHYEPWGQPVFHVSLIGAYRGVESKLIYQAPVYPMLMEQAALFHLVYPEMTPYEIEKRLIYQELSWSAANNLPPEGLRFHNALAKIQVPVLPNPPATRCLIMDIGWVELKRYDAMASTSYRTWEVNCDSEPPNPLVSFAISESKRFEAMWRKQQTAENYAGLINRLDIPALGTAMFDWACRESLPGVAHHILDKGLDPTKAGPDGSWALISAARLGDANLVRRLVEKGVPVNVHEPESWGTTALGAAIKSGNLDVYRVLRKAGATPGAFSSRAARHPIHEAAACGNLVVLQELLAELEGPLPKDPYGQSLLATASGGGQAEVIRFLLDRGLRPEAVDLFRAVQSANPVAVQLLLDAGANPNAAPWPNLSESGEGTGEILREALQRGANVDVIRLLLKYGADPDVRQANTKPETPIELARSLNRPDLVAILEAASMRPNQSANH